MADQATAGEKIAYVVYTVGGNAVEINATETNLDNESADRLTFSNDKEHWSFWWKHVAGVHVKGKPAGVGTGRYRM